MSLKIRQILDLPKNVEIQQHLDSIQTLSQVNKTYNKACTTYSHYFLQANFTAT